MDSQYYVLLLFADDMKVYLKIHKENDEILLQQDLDNLVLWTREWCLKFNAEKCKVVRVTHTGQHEYELNGVTLQEVQQERDLGVEFSSSLKPSLQCTKAVAIAVQTLGIIKRNFVMTDEEDFLSTVSWLCASTFGILCLSLVTIFEKRH